MPKASVILRFTNRSPIRVKNLLAVIRQASWNPNLEIIVVVMEKDVDLSQLKFNGLAGRAKLVKHFVDRPFSSSEANNIGASLAKSNILIFQDADILFNPIAYQKIIHKINSGYEAVRVGEWCQNLSHENSKKIINAHANSPTKGFGRVHKTLKSAQDAYPRSCRDAPGACHAIRKDAFVQNGGYSELFKVYGWEDCYFRYKMQKLKKTNLKMPMLHMHHETNYQISKQPENNHLYSQIISANDKEYESILKRDRKDLLEKYPTLRPQ